MALATADGTGRPAVRMVLLKGHDRRGFVFYTNMESRKGGDLAANPRAALLFHWKSLRRQVRIEGDVEPVGPDDADAYFATRARDSQLGAWASDQSRPLEDRARFEARYADEPFVDVMPAGSHPETRSVRGSNNLRIALSRPGNGDLLIVMVVQDNLVKGAAGQAVQNMNLMFGIPETMGLDQVAILP